MTFIPVKKARAQAGLVPEIRPATEPADSVEKAFSSEILITKAESQAIYALEKLIKNKKNQSEEPDLLYRLAELHMRRAKSGRFFDLEKRYELKMQKLGLPTLSEKKSLRESLKIYKDILNRYPQFQENDFVLFNSALALSKIGEPYQARLFYIQLIEKFPSSQLVPDAHMEVAEIHYSRGEFIQALSHLKSAEKFKENKAYPYAVYKAAWCLYNMRETEKGIEKLLNVAELGRRSPKTEKGYNLRQEALQDLILFVSETKTADAVIDFFYAIADSQEVAQMVVKLSDLYQAHSRHRELIQLVHLYLNRSDESGAVIHLSALLIDAYESLQQRAMVIKSLSKMSEICRTEVKEKLLCYKKFKVVSSEIGEKWWNIWLKNKAHKEFSDLTAQVFEIQLAQPATDMDHWTTRYAYAELLFAQEKYAQAAENYRLISEIPQLDAKTKNESLYSAIFSYEKLNSSDSEENRLLQKKLMFRYHNECRRCEHWAQITSKLAHQSYINSELEKSLSLASLLLTENIPIEIRKTNEDLILDIHNLKKDYASLRIQVELFMKNTNSAERKKELEKLLVQTVTAELDISMNLLSDVEKISVLEKFAASYPSSEESKKSLFKALALALKNSLLVKAGDISMQIAASETEPDINLLQDAAQAYIEAGHLNKAISIHEKYKKLREKKPLVLCELLELENRSQEALDCYLKKFTGTPFEQKSALAATILELLKLEPLHKISATTENFENLLLELKIEPQSTEILTARAETLFQSGQIEKAFALSLKINSRSVEPAHRAAARILQARILQKEFEAQSVRTSIDRLSLVLSIKTEKLDKALTAYHGALKMTELHSQRFFCLQAIDDLYEHFLKSLNDVILNISGTENQKRALSAELTPLIQLFKEKKQLSSSQLAILSEDAELEKPLMVALKSFQSYLALPGQKNVNPPVLKNKESLNIEQALILTAVPETRSIGFYYLSILAHQQAHYRRAVWFAEKSIRLDPEFKLARYQKARSQYYLVHGIKILTHFHQLLEIDFPLKEIHILRAADFYSRKELAQAQAEISKLKKSDISQYKIETLVLKIQESDKQQVSVNKGESI